MSSRRRFLAESGRLSLAAWAVLGQAHMARAAAAGDVDTLRLLTRAARVIYPHDQLSDDVYAGVVGELLMDPDLRTILLGSATELGDFLGLEAAAQISRLRSMEDGEFFMTLRTPLMFALYNTQELWDLIGYPGPSFPIGYVDRGFDDIDWLPAP